MGRIQRLTKLILVSTKTAMSSSIPERPGHRRRHSFGEDEVCFSLLLHFAIKLVMCFLLEVLILLKGYFVLS